MVALKENPLTVAEVNKYGSIVGGSTGAHSSGAGTIKFVDNTRYFGSKVEILATIGQVINLQMN